MLRWPDRPSFCKWEFNFVRERPGRHGKQKTKRWLHHQCVDDGRKSLCQNIPGREYREDLYWRRFRCPLKLLSCLLTNVGRAYAFAVRTLLKVMPPSKSHFKLSIYVPSVMLCIICLLLYYSLQSTNFTICYNQKFSLSFSLPPLTTLSAITTIEKTLCYFYSNLFPSKVIRVVMFTIYFWPKFAWAKP